VNYLPCEYDCSHEPGWCPDDTIAHRLDEAGLHVRLARHVFALIAEHKRKRLAFANGYSRWTEEDWCKVVFADESTFLGAGYHGRAFVRRPDGETLNPEYCLDNRRPYPIQVPAWACFTARAWSRIHGDV
jgi:hypothetical protein